MLMLLEILLAWTVANVVPHLIIIALAGKPYFALTPVPGLLSELSIMSLNLALPLVLLILFHKKGGSSPPERLREGLSWRWHGWSTVGWGLLGFLVGFVLLAPVVNVVIGSEPFSYGGGIGPITSQNFYLCFLFPVLLIVTTLGEEAMFRGYIQTGLAEKYGPAAGIMGAALLFTLRHTPADLYWGWNAPATQWACRLLQLVGLSVTLGLVRHRSKSVIATWISHSLGWIYVVFFSAIF